MTNLLRCIVGASHDPPTRRGLYPTASGHARLEVSLDGEQSGQSIMLGIDRPISLYILLGCAGTTAVWAEPARGLFLGTPYVFDLFRKSTQICVIPGSGENFGTRNAIFAEFGRSNRRILWNDNRLRPKKRSFSQFRKLSRRSVNTRQPGIETAAVSVWTPRVVEFGVRCGEVLLLSSGRKFVGINCGLRLGYTVPRRVFWPVPVVAGPLIRNQRTVPRKRFS